MSGALEAERRRRRLSQRSKLPSLRDSRDASRDPYASRDSATRDGERRRQGEREREREREAREREREREWEREREREREREGEREAAEKQHRQPDVRVGRQRRPGVKSPPLNGGGGGGGGGDVGGQTSRPGSALGYSHNAANSGSFPPPAAPADSSSPRLAAKAALHSQLVFTDHEYHRPPNGGGASISTSPARWPPSPAPYTLNAKP